MVWHQAEKLAMGSVLLGTYSFFKMIIASATALVAKKEKKKKKKKNQA